MCGKSSKVVVGTFGVRSTTGSKRADTGIFDLGVLRAAEEVKSILGSFGHLPPQVCRRVVIVWCAVGDGNVRYFRCGNVHVYV
jgi:hypothetical protein